jgi:hypothetical protein
MPLILLQAVIYIQADPMVWEACKDDSESLCKGIKDGGGRIQSCLVRHLTLRALTQNTVIHFLVVQELVYLVWGL